MAEVGIGDHLRRLAVALMVAAALTGCGSDAAETPSAEAGQDEAESDPSGSEQASDSADQDDGAAEAEPPADDSASADDAQDGDADQNGDANQGGDDGDDGDEGDGEVAELFPDVIAAATQEADGSWTFSATLSSPYDSAARYADAWRVVGPDGEVYGVRELAHDHANEQPFTRSQSGIVIPDDVTVVVVEGRDQVSGWGGATVEVRLDQAG